jgi:hypothetical protein
VAAPAVSSEVLMNDRRFIFFMILKTFLVQIIYSIVFQMQLTLIAFVRAKVLVNLSHAVQLQLI